MLNKIRSDDQANQRVGGGGSAGHFPHSAANLTPKFPIFGSFQSTLNLSALSNPRYFKL